MLKENYVFFTGFGILITSCLILLTKIETGDAVIFFQERRTDFWTCFFSCITRLGEEIPFIAAFLFLLYFRNLREAAFVIFTGVSVSIVAFILKSYFQHPRPRLFFEHKGVFDTFNFPEWLHINTGYTAFPSGHTFAAFALYSILSFFLPQKKTVAVLMLSLAVSVGFSRIYLFQHFLKDVVFGAVLGVALAGIMFMISRNTFQNWNFSIGNRFK